MRHSVEIRNGVNRAIVQPDIATIARLLMPSKSYVSLMPGEKRDIAATYDRREMGNVRHAFVVDGWNVAAGSK